MHHEQIEMANPKQESQSYLRVHEEIPTITAPTVGGIGPFTIATSSITILLITILLVALCGNYYFSSFLHVYLPVKYQLKNLRSQ
jgi:hypothetical protein